jgi:hypothetical protein
MGNLNRTAFTIWTNLVSGINVVYFDQVFCSNHSWLIRAFTNFIPTLSQSPVRTTTDLEYSFSLATHNQFGQARSLGACAPGMLSFAPNGIFIHSA